MYNSYLAYIRRFVTDLLRKSCVAVLLLAASFAATIVHNSVMAQQRNPTLALAWVSRGILTRPSRITLQRQMAFVFTT